MIGSEFIHTESVKKELARDSCFFIFTVQTFLPQKYTLQAAAYEYNATGVMTSF